MAIKINDVAVHKITGEEVWVLQINHCGEIERANGMLDDAVQVRRPTQTNDGVKHLVEWFHAAELESLEDSYARKRERTRRERNEQLADQAELQQKIMQLKPTKPSYSFEQEPYEVQ